MWLPWSLLFEVIVRRGIPVFLLLAISIPVAVSCLACYVAEMTRTEIIESRRLAGKTYCVMNDGDDRLVYGILIYDDLRAEVPVIVMKSSSYKSLFGQNISDGGMSISGYLARRFRITRENTVIVCLPEGCLNMTIERIHDNKGFTAVSVIIVNDTYRGGERFSLSISQGCGAIRLEEIFSSETAYLELMPYLIAVAVSPIIMIGYSRIIDLLRHDLSLLYGLGLPVRRIALALLVSLLISGILSLLLGLSMGIVVSHLGLWLVHVFTGFPYVVLGVPGMMLLILISYLCIIVILSIYYSVRLDGGILV